MKFNKDETVYFYRTPLAKTQGSKIYCKVLEVTPTPGNICYKLMPLDTADYSSRTPSGVYYVDEHRIFPDDRLPLALMGSTQQPSQGLSSGAALDTRQWRMP